KVLRLKERGNPLTLDFETRNNPQICLSIVYHSGGSHWEFPVAAEMKIASETINHHLQVGIGADNENQIINETKLKDDRDNQFSYECPHGNFGEKCDIECSEFGGIKCKGLRVCSTSVCSCLPECPGYFSTNCRIPCKHCRNQAQCDFVNGACPNADCEEGYMPGQGALCENRKGNLDETVTKAAALFARLRINAPTPMDFVHQIDAAMNFMSHLHVNIVTRLVLKKQPELKKYGIASFQLSIPSEGIPEEIRHLSTTEWHEVSRLTPNDDLSEIEVSGLTPKTTYDVRVILYDARGNGNLGDKVPVLSGVTTLCKPAEKSGIQVETEGKIIKVKIITSGNKEECDQSSDYVISIRDTGKYVILKEDLTGHSAELEYDTFYTVEIKASDMVETFEVSTEQGHTSPATTIIGVLLFLIFVLLAFTLAFWLYQKRNSKSLDRQKLHRSLASNGEM
ncbi:hypothetical protein B566_EDAN011466, partial [Ephemera danica]